AAGTAETVRPPPVEARDRRGTETVLVAEDEAGVRALVQNVLTDHGYTVIASGSGDEAEGLAAEFPHLIDLLLTDVVMPGLKGPELARRLTARRPGLRVLYMSGYTEEAVGSFQSPDGDARILRKPFTPADLARTVREVLDQPRPVVSPPHGAAGSLPHA
ncbi:MAG: response regulator, partial [Nitrospiria bacterium]